MSFSVPPGILSLFSFALSGDRRPVTPTLSIVSVWAISVSVGRISSIIGWLIAWLSAREVFLSDWSSITVPFSALLFSRVEVFDVKSFGVIYLFFFALSGVRRS